MAHPKRSGQVRLKRAGSYLKGHPCRLQVQFALSSGEAELYSSVHGVREFVGFFNLLRGRFGEDWSIFSVELILPLVLRRGAGGTNHLQVKDLWVQEVVRNYGIKVVKIPEELNVATLLHPVHTMGWQQGVLP